MATECIERNVEVGGDETLHVEETAVCTGDGTTCVECSKSFTHPFYFSTHISTHLSHKGFVAVGQCTFCGLVFSDEQKFNDHMISAQSRQEEQAMSQDDVSTELALPDVDSELSSQLNQHSQDNDLESNQGDPFNPDKEVTTATDEDPVIKEENSTTTNEEKPKRKRKAPDRFVPNQKVPSTSSRSDSDPAVEAYLASLAEMGLTVDPEAFANHRNGKRQKRVTDNGLDQDRSGKGGTRLEGVRGASSNNKQPKSTSQGLVYLDIADDELPKEEIQENVYMDIADDELPKEEIQENVYLDIADDEPAKDTSQENVYLDIPDEERMQYKEEIQENVYLDIAGDDPAKETSQENVNSDIADDKPPKETGQTNVLLDIADNEPKKETSQEQLCLDVADDEPKKETSQEQDIADNKPPKETNKEQDIADDKPPKETSQEQEIADDKPPKETSQEQDIADDKPPKETSHEIVLLDIADDEHPLEISDEKVFLEISDSPVDDLEALLEKLEQQNDKLGQIKGHARVTDGNKSNRVGLNTERAGQKHSISQNALGNKIITAKVPKLAANATPSKGNMLSPNLTDKNKAWQASNIGRTNNVASHMKANTFTPPYSSQGANFNTTRQQSASHSVNRNPQHNGFFNPTVNNRSNVYNPQANNVSNHEQTALNHQPGRGRNDKLASNVGNTNVQKSSSLEDLKKDSRENVVEMLQSIGMIALTSTSLAPKKVAPPQKPAARLPSLPPNKRLDLGPGLNNINYSGGGMQNRPLNTNKIMAPQRRLDLGPGLNNINYSGGGMQNRPLNTNKIMAPQRTQFNTNQSGFGYDPYANRGSFGMQQYNHSSPQSFRGSPVLPGHYPRGAGFIRGRGAGVVRGQQMNVNMRGPIFSNPGRGRARPEYSSGALRGRAGANYINRQPRPQQMSNEIIIIDDEDTNSKQGNATSKQTQTVKKHANTINKNANTSNKPAKIPCVSNEIIVIDEDDDDIILVGTEESSKADPVLGKTEVDNTVNLESDKSVEGKISGKNDDSQDDKLACSSSDTKTTIDNTDEPITATTVETISSLMSLVASCEDASLKDAESNAAAENDLCQSGLDNSGSKSTDAFVNVCLKTEKGDDICYNEKGKDNELIGNKIDSDNDGKKMEDTALHGIKLEQDNDQDEKKIAGDTDPRDVKIGEGADLCDIKTEKDNHLFDNKIADGTDLCDIKIEKDNDLFDNKIEKDSDLFDNKIWKDKDLADCEEGNDSENGLNDNVDIMPGEDIDGWKVCLAQDSDSEDDCTASASGAHKKSSHGAGHLSLKENAKLDHFSLSVIEASHGSAKDDAPLFYQGCQNLVDESFDKPSSQKGEESPESLEQHMCSPQHQTLATETSDEPSSPQAESPEQHMCSPQHKTLTFETIIEPSSPQAESPEQHMCSPQHKTLTFETIIEPSSPQVETYSDSPEQHVRSPQHQTRATKTFDEPSSPKDEKSPESLEQHMWSPLHQTLATKTSDEPSSPQAETSSESPEQHVYSPQHQNQTDETIDEPSSPQAETNSDSPEQHVRSPQHQTLTTPTLGETLKQLDGCFMDCYSDVADSNRPDSSSETMCGEIENVLQNSLVSDCSSHLPNVDPGTDLAGCIL